MITIYTDGSYIEKERIGGWSAIIVDGENETVISGGTFHSKENAENVTAQRMEIQAVLEGLFTLSHPSEVLIVTDSSYVCDTIDKKWLIKWIEESDFEKKHFDLWRMIYNLMKIHDIKIERVKAHNGHHYNERCDRLAKQAAKDQINTYKYKKMYETSSKKKNVDLFEIPIKNKGFKEESIEGLFSNNNIAPFDNIVSCDNIDSEVDSSKHNEKFNIKSSEINKIEDLETKKTSRTSRTSKKKKSSNKGYYAVAVGRKTGIFKTWIECQKQIHKYRGAKFKKFNTEEEAKKFIQINKK